MIPKVLIVDDSKEMLFALSEGLEKYEDKFSVVLSKNGLDAVEQLKANTFSLVVTDLKMPKMDGFSLLTHVMEKYPGIPVIVITGYSTPQMETMANDGGAIGYIEKPFMIDDLADRISTTLSTQSDGGSLQNVTSSMFLQLVEMEQKTCTIRLTDRLTDEQGVLFFNNGELLDARIGDKNGEHAAYVLFSWDEVNLSIQNSCAITENFIKKDVQAVFLEALRLKDEAESIHEDPSSDNTEPEFEPELEPELEPDSEPSVVEPVGKPPASKPKTATLAPASGKKDPAAVIRQKIQTKLGTKSGVQEIYTDPKWNSLMLAMEKVALAIGAGDLKLAMVNNKGPSDFILIPGLEPTVVKINPKSPRDRIIDALRV
ncbi:MAG: response regulator [Desulfobacteraceae bacterium]|nr:response regulator [Desulfobacteraceae bacterium]